MTDPVRVERNGPVTTVIINRPGARNAVNGPTAAALYEAFDEFDRDDTASVAVLWGDNGTFCAGADLKAFGTPDANAVHRDRPRPDGPDADGAVQTGHRRGQRLRRRRAAWSWRSGAICGWPRRTPCSACSAGAGGFRSSTAAPCGCRG